MSTPPTIEYLRKRISKSRDLLIDAGRVVEGLHSLAYDRPSSGERLGVKESAPEGYSLDGHGDLRARSAYAALARHLDAACGQIIGACEDAVQRVSEGDEKGENRRAPVVIEVVEHLEAIDAQARRGRRGEFSPGRTMTQPVRSGTEKSAIRRIRTLEGEIKRRDRAEQRRIRTLEAQVRRKDHTIDARDRTIAALRLELGGRAADGVAPR